MSKHYGYIRITSQVDSDIMLGEETQKRIIQAYCQQNKITLDGIFTDAKNPETDDPEHERPELWKLFDVLSEEDIIIVTNTGILWKDDVMRIYIEKSIKRKNGHVISVEQPRYSIYEPQEFLFNSIMEIMDQYDCAREAAYLDKCSCCDKIPK